MKKRTLSLLSTALTAAISASMLICAVPVSAADNAKVVLNGEEMSLDDLIKNAQKEGNLQSVGMLMTGQNWKGSWGSDHRYLWHLSRRCGYDFCRRAFTVCS